MDRPRYGQKNHRLMYLFIKMKAGYEKAAKTAIMDSTTGRGGLPLGHCTTKYLMRDRDAIYGVIFRNRVKNMGIKEVILRPAKTLAKPVC
jgi:hypothetical protein